MVKLKKTAAALLLTAVIFHLLCYGTSVGTGSESRYTNSNNVVASVDDGIISNNSYEIWTIPSTVKVKRDDVNYRYKQAAKVSLNCIMNEYENTQIGITAKTDIANYSLSLSDLTSAYGNVFSKDNFTVYNEKFVSIKTVADISHYGAGEYPDALIPTEYAAAAGEMNVKMGKNAFLWLTVYIPKTTIPGTYTGTFSLKIDNKTETLPVSVKINDYVLTDDCTLPTSFGLRYDRIASGELDNSLEMLNAYFDLFSDYRISFKGLPLYSDSIADFVKAVKSVYNNVSAYPLISVVGDVPLEYLNKIQYVREQILSLAAESNEDVNYLDKAYFYLYDEPNLSDTEVLDSAIFTYETLHGQLNDIVSEIKRDDLGKYNEFKKRADWENTILNIMNMVPFYSKSTINLLQYDSQVRYLFSMINRWCPSYELTGKEYGATLNNVLQDINKEYGTENSLWIYTAWSPLSPYPTYHIGDTNLMSGRAISWMAQKNDFQGILYWEGSSYWSEEYGTSIDYYETPYSSMSLVSGDGNLTYPGAKYSKYGAYGPFPSMRLMSIRDGMEEYEMLADFKKLASELIESEKLDVEVNDLTQVFYSELIFDEIKIQHDLSETNFSGIRELLIDYLQCLNNDVNFAVLTRERSNNYETIRFFAETDCIVTVNGQATERNGNICSYSYDLIYGDTDALEVKVNKSGESYSFNIARSLYRVDLIDSATYVLTTESKYIENEKLAELHSVYIEGEDEEVAIRFQPSISFAKGSIGGYTLSDFNNIIFNIDNFMTKETVLHISLVTGELGGAKTSRIINVSVKSGRAIFEIPLADFNLTDYSAVTGIRIAVTNAKGTDNSPIIYKIGINSVVLE